MARRTDEPTEPKNRRVRKKPEVLVESEPRVPLAQRLAALRTLGARLKRPVLFFLRAVVVIAIGGGALAVGRLVERHVRTSPAFAVREIDVDGHARLTREEILSQAGIALETNVFDVSPQEAEERLTEHPWIAEARVRRRLPSRYEIEVRERRAVALLALGDVFLVADDGSVFKRAEEEDPIDLPVITGIDRDRFTRDRAFRTSVLLEVVALVHDYQGAGLLRREPIGEVHVERDGGLSLYVGDDATYVRLGHGPFRPKLRRLRTVLDELSRRGARALYVYLDNERRPDRVTVRIREPEEIGAEPGADDAGASDAPPEHDAALALR